MSDNRLNLDESLLPAGDDKITSAVEERLALEHEERLKAEAAAAAQSARALDAQQSPEEEYAKQNPGLSTAESFVHNASELLGGLPESIADQVLPPEMRARPEGFEEKFREASAKEHPLAGLAGKAVGLATSLGVAEAAAPVGNLAERTIVGSKAAATAAGAGADALEEAGLGQLSTSAAPSLARQAAGRTANYAIRGAAQAWPSATKAAWEGDYDKAAESILWGAGVGAAFGGLGVVTKAGLSRAANWAIEHEAGPEIGAEAAAKKAIQQGVKLVAQGVGQGVRLGAGALGAHAIPYVGGVAAYEGSKFVEDAIKKSAMKWAEGTGGVQVGATFLRKLASDPFNMGLGQAMAQQGTSAVDQQLSRIPSVLAAIATAPPTKRQPVTQLQLEKMKRDYDRIASSGASDDGLAHLAGSLSHDPATQELAQRVHLKMINAATQMSQQIPHPLPATPFAPSPVRMTRQQLQKVTDQHDVLNNPFVIYDLLKDGTLSTEHVKALDSYYPRIAQRMRDGITIVASSPRAPKLTYDQRNVLSKLMKQPLDRVKAVAPSPAPAATQLNSAGNRRGMGGQKGPDGFPSRSAKPVKLPEMSTAFDRVGWGEEGRLR